MMTIPFKAAMLAAAMIAALSTSGPASAVRLNADGQGQALIYPYFTARSTPSGAAYVTALSVTNPSTRPKALKVRFLEGKAGAVVLDFNLYLAAYDVWTAGVVAAGEGAALFSQDHSCTSPVVSNSAASPTKFRNIDYASDGLGASLDRTYEGYFEILEMASIDPNSLLGKAIAPVMDLSASNASKPTCAALPNSDTVPAGLLAPTGGLIGNVSYINVNEGTDYSVDATALSQWSDKVQWGAPGSLHPDLADASPPVSFVVAAQDAGDVAYVSTWENGRDAVSALFQVESVTNDFTVEPMIKAATEWIVTMPTKRFYVQRTGAAAPFSAALQSTIGEVVSLLYWDREQASPGSVICFFGLCGYSLPHASTSIAFMRNAGQVISGTVLSSQNVSTYGDRLVPLIAGWINGWADLDFRTSLQHALTAPAGKTTVMDAKTGAVVSNASVTYFGLPVMGFAVQSYSTNGLPGVNPNVLSNYGGLFNHKYRRRIEASR